MNPSIEKKPATLTASRYTLRLWVLFILPFVSGLILTFVFGWSFFWASIVIGLALFVLIFNIVAVVNHWYRKPAGHIPVIVQIYFACFFGVMLLGKAFPVWWMQMILILIFLINAVLGYWFRKRITSIGWFSKVTLTVTTLFPTLFAIIVVSFLNIDTGPVSLEAPGLISSLCAGFAYFSGVIIESLYKF